MNLYFGTVFLFSFLQTCLTKCTLVSLQLAFSLLSSAFFSQGKEKPASEFLFYSSGVKLRGILRFSSQRGTNQSAAVFFQPRNKKKRRKRLKYPALSLSLFSHPVLFPDKEKVSVRLAKKTEPFKINQAKDCNRLKWLSVWRHLSLGSVLSRGLKPGCFQRPGDYLDSGTFCPSVSVTSRLTKMNLTVGPRF